MSKYPEERKTGRLAIFCMICAAVSAGLHCTFGLKTDGTAVMAGKIVETEKALL